MSRFHVIARNETGNWDSEFLAAHGIRAAFGLYLVKEGEATFCCEITPSSRADWLENAFILEDGAEEEDPERDAAIHDNGGADGCIYLQPMFDPDKLDSRFHVYIGNPAEDCPEDVDPEDPESEWECAREWQATNPSEPRILCASTFNEWEAEETARRRAENRPPLAGWDQLPLFASAVKAERAARGWHDLAAVSIEEGRAEWAEYKQRGWV